MNEQLLQSVLKLNYLIKTLDQEDISLNSTDVGGLAIILVEVHDALVDCLNELNIEPPTNAVN